MFSIVVDVADVLLLHAPSPESSLRGTACANTLFWGIRNSGFFEQPVQSHQAPALASTQPELYKALLQALIQARKDAGITQVELAARIGRRQTFVSKYETEERRLDVAEYIAIARAIEAEPFELMRTADDRELGQL
ncbi:helix-turn-helix transcriptional regulator [Bosea sp. CCNWLW174]|uniref:helix-turn-helix domain-containing protein n=1 Tax=Bosea sp. CCNWLW174 TaxID=3128896 RepID=UPI00307D6768